MHSRRLSPAFIEFEPAQIFVESRREFSLVWPAFESCMRGLPRCKNLTRFSLFASFCFAVRYCFKCLCFLCFTSSVRFTGSYTAVKPAWEFCGQQLLHLRQRAQLPPQTTWRPCLCRGNQGNWQNSMQKLIARWGVCMNIGNKHAAALRLRERFIALDSRLSRTPCLFTRTILAQLHGQMTPFLAMRWTLVNSRSRLSGRTISARVEENSRTTLIL